MGFTIGDGSRLKAELQKDLLVGTGVESGRDVYLPLDDIKRTSVHIVGAAGYGKSRFLMSLLQQLIKYDQPFALIDPHRELYEFVLSRLRRSAVSPQRIVLIDPGDDRHATAFNPLFCGVEDVDEAAGLVLEAVLKAWGARSFDAMPRAEAFLRGTFRLLISNGLTLLEAPDVLNVDNVALRKALLQQVTDPWTRDDWQQFEQWPRSEKLALLESSRNRIRRFIQSSRSMQLMLGQHRNTLDFRRIMDRRQFLLANVGNTSSPETSRLLGALIVNGIYHAAKQRNTRTAPSFFLVIDEAGQFATRDLAESLDQLRKFKVHVVAAHQRLSQLEREDPDLLSSMLTNAKVRIVFGGLERREAERLAPELFTGQVHGERVKHVSMSTKFRPVFDTFVVKTETWSESDGESDSSMSADSFSSGSSESELDSDSASFAIDDDNRHGRHDEDDVVSRSLGTSRSRGTTKSESRSSSSSQTASHASSVGGSKSRVPIVRHERFQEESSRTYWGLDEQWETLTARLHGLPKREALIRVHNGAVLHIRTPDVSDQVDDTAQRRFTEKVLTHSPHVQSTEHVVREIEERRRTVAALVERCETGTRPFKVKSFKE